MKTHLLILLGLIAFSCTKEEYNFDKLSKSELSPEMAAPIVHSTLALKDLIKSTENTGFVKEDANGLLSIVYRSTAFSKKVKDVVKFPNQPPTTAHYEFVIPPTLPGGTYTYPYYKTFYLTTDHEEKLDSMFLKSGLLDVTLTSDLNYESTINVSSRQLTKNGDSLNVFIPYSDITKAINKTIDLSGYKIDFSSSDSNKISVLYKITAKIDNNKPISIFPYSVDLNVEIKNLDFQSIYGYLGNQTFNIDMDTLQIDLFKNKIDEKYTIGNPSINIYLNNSIGVPIRASFLTFKGVNGDIGVSLAGEGLPNPWYLNYPEIPGRSDETSLILNQDPGPHNCNILNVLDIKPKQLLYQIRADLNPLGYTTVQNFVIDTSSINLDVELELPMHGRLGSFVMQDTIDMNLNDVFGDIDMIDYVNFLVKIKNGFPFNINAQIYFVDSLYKPLGTLFTTNTDIIKAAKPEGPLLKPITTGDSFNEIVFTNTKLKQIKNTKHLLINAKLSTYNADDGVTLIKIYSDYIMDVKLGIQTKLKVKI